MIAQASKPRFAIGPLTEFEDAGAMRAWLRSAPVGERLRYALGPSLGGGDHPAAALAREWEKAGLVRLFAPRSAERAHCFEYIAEKRSVVTAVAGPADEVRRPKRPDPAFSETPEGQVYRVIARCAAAQLPCPSNTAIGDLLGLESRHIARHLFDQLVAAGHLRVIEGNRFGARVVEIAATGARTGSTELRSLKLGARG